MQNILLVNHDGPDAHGLVILRDALKRQYRRARIFTMTPDSFAGHLGTGSGTTHLDAMAAEKVGKDVLVFAGASPVDIVHYAFQKKDEFLRAGTWDLVASGVTHGATVGLGIIRSAAAMAALTAATHYQSTGFHFAQALPANGERADDEKDFRPAAVYLKNFLAGTKAFPGECRNVNFPTTDRSQSWRHCAAAPFDPAVGPDFLPVATPLDQFDSAILEKGEITETELILAINVPVRWGA